MQFVKRDQRKFIYLRCAVFKSAGYDATDLLEQGMESPEAV